MPVSKENPTTSPPERATPESSPPELPEQQVFHQYLRLLTRSAVRTVIEAVMREELVQLQETTCARGRKNDTMRA